MVATPVTRLMPAAPAEAAHTWPACVHCGTRDSVGRWGKTSTATWLRCSACRRTWCLTNTAIFSLDSASQSGTVQLRASFAAANAAEIGSSQKEPNHEQRPADRMVE